MRQYVVLTNQGLAGVATADGELLWQHRRDRPSGTEVINTPLVRGDHVYTTAAAGNGGCKLVRVERAGDGFNATRVYENKKLLNHHGNVALAGGHVYGASQGRGWVCQDFRTGEVAWSEGKLGPGSATWADGRLYCYAETDGTVALVDAAPAGWTEVGRLRPPQASKQRQPQGKVWAPPVVAGGRLFLRDRELLFCYDVRAK